MATAPRKPNKPDTTAAVQDGDGRGGARRCGQAGARSGVLRRPAAAHLRQGAARQPAPAADAARYRRGARPGRCDGDAAREPRPRHPPPPLAGRSRGARRVRRARAGAGRGARRAAHAGHGRQYPRDARRPAVPLEPRRSHQEGRRADRRGAGADPPRKARGRAHPALGQCAGRALAYRDRAEGRVLADDAAHPLRGPGPVCPRRQAAAARPESRSRRRTRRR